MQPEESESFLVNLNEHIANLDHGQLAGLVGDARIVELVSAIVKSRRDLEEKDQGQLVLDIVGGFQSIVEDKTKRNKFFLTLTGAQRAALAKILGVNSLDKFTLTADRRLLLYESFGQSPPEKASFQLRPAVSCVPALYGLFPHQTDALLKCLEYLNSTIPKVMLHMPTGSGKTRTAMHLMCRHLNSRKKGLVLWLVSGKELCDQAAMEFQKAWPHLGERPLPLVCAWEGRRIVDLPSFEEHQHANQLKVNEFKNDIWPESLEDGLIVGSLDTIWEMIQRWEPGGFSRRASQVSLIIFDEAHRAAAATYSKIITSICAESNCGLLGLSATPGRAHYGEKGEQTNSLVELFGQQKVQLAIDGYTSPVEALIEQGYLARLSKERLVVADSGLSKKDLTTLNKQLETALDLPDETLRFLGVNATRNLQIIERVERLVKDESHKRIIVFAPSVESSQLIASVLNSRQIRAASVTAKTEPAIRTLITDEYKKKDSEPFILCNYGVLTTGFDAPQTSGVVIARPTLSIVLLNQMAGRAIRGENVGGNKKALLITVVDTSIPELVNTINQFHAFDDAWEKLESYG